MSKDYKKLYEESIERARDLHDNHAFGKPFIYETCEYIFPELRESEDEKIKKALIKNFTNQHSSNFPTTDGFTREQILAWLEKQGEQNPADKVESKFNVGDWITNGEYTWKVTDIKPLDYILQSQNGVVVYDTISYVNEHFHLWTIQDAKDGDVLVTDSGRPFIFKGCLDERHPNSPVSYCGINSTDYFYGYNGNEWWTDENVYPATKEQHDLLFQKMKEAGYEWDAEKKELKKIEQEEDAELTDFESALFSAFSDAWQEYLSGKEVDAAKWTREHSSELLEVAREQNHDWSEEDEMMLNDIIRALKSTEYLIFTCDCQGKTQIASRINWLKTLKDKVQPQPKQEWNEKDEHCIELLLPIIDSSSLIPKNRKKCKEFLKSLKDRVQPQPEQEWSEEDEEFISILIECINQLYVVSEKLCKYEDRDRLNPKHKDWLIEKIKSLKSQPHWKPSEQNIKDLEWCADLVKDKMGVGFHRLQVFIDELKNFES